MSSNGADDTELAQEGDLPIDGAAEQDVGQDECVNTVDDGGMEPDVIGTYTEAQPEDAEQGDYVQEQTEELQGEAEAEQEAQSQDAEAPAGSRPASGAPGSAAVSAAGSRPASVAAGSPAGSAAGSAAGSRPHSSASAAPPSRSGSMQAQQDPAPGSRPASALGAAGSRPASALAQADAASAAGSRPASAMGEAAAGSRPASAMDEAAAGSRPASAMGEASMPAAGSRPASSASAQPTSGSRAASVTGEAAAAAGSRPASVAGEPAAGSRPASVAAAGSRPASVTGDAAAAAGSRQASVAGGSRPASVTGDAAAAAGSRQASVAGGSRPASVTGDAAAAAGSRPASVAGEPAAGSRPASVAAAGSRPASVAGEAPATAGSRPASVAGAGSRPVSVAGEAAPPPGSRPGSSLLLPAVTGSRPASVATATAAADLPLSAQVPSAGGSRAGTAPGPSAAPAPAPGSRPASVANGTANQASGSSRPPSGTPAPMGGVPGAEAAEARPSSAALKAQAAEQGGYAVAGMRAIDVEIDQGPGLPHSMLRVYMDYTQTNTKSYLGGFRNKRTGATYHHAVTQTPKAPKYAGAQPKLERQTQTVKVSTRGQQSVREAATQMERPGVTLDTTYDVMKTPGRYQTSEERLAIVTAATRTIQRWVRGWMGRKRAAYLRSKKRERETFLEEQESKAQQAAEEHRRREIERRMHPRTAADFEILYNELEAWRLQETRKIKDAGLAPDKEQEVLQQLLHKETKLLQTIDRLKINANHENKDIRIQHTLGDMSKPKQYELKNGHKVEVHTPFTTRAKELMQLYNGLNLPMLTIDERLDVLLHVKWTVKEFDCNLTREIVALIDREADLLNRGRSPGMLEGLRKRISSMFLNFIETPEFNPEAARFQVVPMDFESYMFQKLEKSSSPAVTVLTGASKWDA